MSGYQYTSALAFQSIKDNIGAKQYQVLCAISILGECNNQEIARHLGWEINRNTPRVYELRRKGLVEEIGKEKDAVTGKLTNFWRVKNEVWKQKENTLQL